LLDEYSFGELDVLEERRLEDEQLSVVQHDDLVIEDEISDSTTYPSANKITSTKLNEAQKSPRASGDFLELYL